VPKAAKEPKVSSEPSIDREERTDVHERVQFEVREEARLNHNQNHNQNHHYDAGDTRIPISDVASSDHLPPGATKVDVAAMQAMAITPEYARAMQVGNFRPNSGELIALKALGVFPDYLAALSAAGFKGSAGDVMQARAMGITREDIEHAMKLGLEDLTIDKLIQLELSSAL
jgi:hypothetical protein